MPACFKPFGDNRIHSGIFCLFCKFGTTHNVKHSNSTFLEQTCKLCRISGRSDYHRYLVFKNRLKVPIDIRIE